MSTIKIIIGSTRPGRFASTFAKWLTTIAKEFEAANPGGPRFELVDLADQKLPLLDEAVPANMNKYEHDHTKRWSKVVGEADGFVFVTQEYNHGYSASLKNAIDYLFYEWNNKPVAFASYGGAAGGARAVEQLREVSGEVKLFDIREAVIVPNYWTQFDASGAFNATDDQAKAAGAMFQALSFWTDEMKASRARLAAKA
ncbi:MAG: NADPH-dependent FMN reductase [Spirochaetae bacterium HGW-Spirochaetae-7]|jgi:NAD(P)H-dependent FMN reductase|nr:MAG: NADPH-dependent FMN reductase [Spirochaetae bacterium HGW-Spirochaetae-7]